MNKQCTNCSKTFRVDDQDNVFYQMMQVPEPTFCPACRLQRRLAWRNERALYQRPCQMCQKTTVCLQRPDGPIITYCSACWWSDKWEPFAYGRDYDFSRTFFEQFVELLHAVPHQSTDIMYLTFENSDFNNMGHYLRNCYLLFNSDYNDNCSYGTEIEHSKDCVDNTLVDECELCYEAVNCQQCFQAFWSVDCINSRHIWFSKNLVNCSNCVGCINLRNKEYYIFNQPYSKEEYEKKVADMKLGTYSGVQVVQQQAHDTWLKHPHKYMHGTRNENVSGDYIYNSRQTHDTYIATEADNCRYCMWLIVKNNRDCYDYTQFGEEVEKIYESAVCGKESQNVIGGFRILESSSIRYSMHSYGSKNLFGCVGIRNKQYCILNKQYTKEAYETLTQKIVEQMNQLPYQDSKGRKHYYGDYFPAELSHFAYNESTAYQFFPLTKENIVAQGYQWYEPADRAKPTALQTEELPDAITQVNESVKQSVIACLHHGDCQHQCTKQYRITAPEFDFYKQQGLPLPRICPNCRHYERAKFMNPVQVWRRQCMCTQTDHQHQGLCSTEFDTTYSPERKEIVYCEECYKKEIY
ncbi:MAG: hypothetical protein ACD_41C00123G0002 [uncultured bacterium]|nr:MAG: hypothetical protein ACD_41C00123G0002 [uncultured bacterium]